MARSLIDWGRVLGVWARIVLLAGRHSGRYVILGIFIVSLESTYLARGAFSGWLSAHITVYMSMEIYIYMNVRWKRGVLERLRKVML